MRTRLAHDETHVWIARVSDVRRSEAEFRRSLSAFELERADRFVASSDRTRYVVAHGLLREIVGTYVGKAPHRLRFTAGRYGKPAIDGDSGLAPLQFNLSHSYDVVAVALAHGRAVGVDVEHVAEIPFEAVVDVCFSRSERLALSALDAPYRLATFYRMWTRKEAYLKALGSGIGDDLTTFDVSFDRDRPRLVCDRNDPSALDRWRLDNLDVPVGYAGTVVTDRPANRVRQMYVEPRP